MALREGGTGIFLGIYDGKICQKCSSDDEGAKERIDKTGKVVYEKFYYSVYGKLINISIRSHAEYGDSWILHLRDEGKDYFLQIPYSSRQADGFLRRLPNVKFENNIEIACGKYNEKAYLVIKQYGEKVEYFWTRENPKGLPPMVEKVVNGKTVWDDTEKMKYLRNIVMTRIVPKLRELNPIDNVSPVDQVDDYFTPTAPPPPPPPPKEYTEADVPDDLPF